MRSTRHSSAHGTSPPATPTQPAPEPPSTSGMSKKLLRELHIDANPSLGGVGSSSRKRKRRETSEHKQEQEQDQPTPHQTTQSRSLGSSGGGGGIPPTPPSSHNTASPRLDAHSKLAVTTKTEEQTETGSPGPAPRVNGKTQPQMQSQQQPQQPHQTCITSEPAMNGELTTAAATSASPALLRRTKTITDYFTKASCAAPPSPAAHPAKKRKTDDTEGGAELKKKDFTNNDELTTTDHLSNKNELTKNELTTKEEATNKDQLTRKDELTNKDEHINENESTNRDVVIDKDQLSKTDELTSIDNDKRHVLGDPEPSTAHPKNAITARPKHISPARSKNTITREKEYATPALTRTSDRVSLAPQFATAHSDMEIDAPPPSDTLTSPPRPSTAQSTTRPASAPSNKATTPSRMKKLPIDIDGDEAPPSTAMPAFTPINPSCSTVAHGDAPERATAPPIEAAPTSAHSPRPATSTAPLTTPALVTAPSTSIAAPSPSSAAPSLSAAAASPSSARRKMAEQTDHVDHVTASPIKRSSRKRKPTARVLDTLASPTTPTTSTLKTERAHSTAAASHVKKPRVSATSDRSLRSQSEHGLVPPYLSATHPTPPGTVAGATMVKNWKRYHFATQVDAKDYVRSIGLSLTSSRKSSSRNINQAVDGKGGEDDEDEDGDEDENDDDDVDKTKDELQDDDQNDNEDNDRTENGRSEADGISSPPIRSRTRPSLARTSTTSLAANDDTENLDHDHQRGNSQPLEFIISASGKRKRKRGVVTTLTMVKNWKRYGFPSQEAAKKDAKRKMDSRPLSSTNEDSTNSTAAAAAHAPSNTATAHSSSNAAAESVSSPALTSPPSNPVVDFADAPHPDSDESEQDHDDATSDGDPPRRDASTPPHQLGTVERKKIRRKGYVGPETMVKNWKRYKFHSQELARQVAASVKAGEEIAVEDIIYQRDLLQAEAEAQPGYAHASTSASSPAQREPRLVHNDEGHRIPHFPTVVKYFRRYGYDGPSDARADYDKQRGVFSVDSTDPGRRSGWDPLMRPPPAPVHDRKHATGDGKRAGKKETARAEKLERERKRLTIDAEPALLGVDAVDTTRTTTTRSKRKSFSTSAAEEARETATRPVKKVKLSLPLGRNRGAMTSRRGRPCTTRTERNPNGDLMFLPADPDSPDAELNEAPDAEPDEYIKPNPVAVDHLLHVFGELYKGAEEEERLRKAKRAAEKAKHALAPTGANAEHDKDHEEHDVSDRQVDHQAVRQADDQGGNQRDHNQQGMDVDQAKSTANDSAVLCERDALRPLDPAASSTHGVRDKTNEIAKDLAVMAEWELA